MFFYNSLFKSQESFPWKQVFKFGEPNTENELADWKVFRFLKYINPNDTEYQCRLNVYSEDDNDNSDEDLWDGGDDP
jgi:hypothetical protein